jgi:hypothetical protein
MGGAAITALFCAKGALASSTVCITLCNGFGLGQDWF